MSRLTRYLRDLAQLAFANPGRRGLKWPPGTLNFFRSVQRQGQDYLLRLAAAHGPIFKVWMQGHYTTCVIGHDAGARLLRKGQAWMTGVTIEQSSLYPVGNLRHMQGDQHRHYRRRIMEAVNASPLSARQPPATALIGARLDTLSSTCRDKPIPAAELRRCLHQAASDCMIALAYGVQPASDLGHRLAAAYDRLGYRAPSNRVGAYQHEAFAEIATLLRGLASSQDGNPGSFLGHLAAAGALDDTLIGNLVYIIETTRFDIASLWRWILYYLCSDPAVLAGARHGDDAYLDAIVHETLRLNQSEYLMRQVSEPFAFDGHVIPKDSRVRICVWEGHKNPDTFPDPFTFRPERFLERSFGVDQYAPFGMDKHRCLGADLTVQLSRAFLRAVLDRFAVEPLNIGAPVRGKHHWEPNEAFTVRLTPLDAAASDGASPTGSSQ